VIVAWNANTAKGRVMSDESSPPKRLTWARLRFSIIGPLLSSPPEDGELQTRLEALSRQQWQHPTAGHRVYFAKSTIERWYYQAKNATSDPVAALARKIPKHAGTHPSLTPRVIAAMRQLRADHPGWTYQLVHDNLCVLVEKESTLGHMPSYTTVRRWLREAGLSPRRGALGKNASRTREPRETRSFEVSHVGGLWHLDFHGASRKVLLPSGEWAQPQLLAVIDDRSRLCCHAQWYLSPSTEALTHAVSQAILKRGLPRALMSDNGSAMISGETEAGLLLLGIEHERTWTRSPEQNGKQESWWGSIEGRLIAMLEGERQLTLDLLNRATQAWVELEYNRSEHAEIKQTPLSRFLAGPSVLREAPPIDHLRHVFRIEEKRQQRRSDGTVSVGGRRYEIPSAYRTLREITVRFARWNMSSLDMVDPRSGARLCTLLPLDKEKNADGRRRVLADAATTDAPAKNDAIGIAPLLAKLMAEYAATGLPPSYLPLDERREHAPTEEEVR
jgi:transposase InsO family protein